MISFNIILLCQITPDKRDVRSMVTVEGDTFKHVSRAKKEGVTGHTVVTEFKGDEVTRLAGTLSLFLF